MSDAANSRVEEFKENGEFASMFGYGVRDSKTEFEVCTTGCKAGISGSGNGQFNAPRSVAVTPAGNVWVVESANSRVQEFNEKSEYVLQFGTKGSGNGQLKEPKGIALAANGNVIVADEGNSRIEIFSPTGTFLTTFGTKGTGTSQFEEPMSIAITPNENLYITDVKNSRVEEWEPVTTQPAYLSVFGSKGKEGGQLTEPHGAAVAKNGALLVVDSGNSRVEEFSQAGKYEAQFGSSGSGNSQFSSPYAITVDSKGNIWVTDQGNNRVEEFNEKHEFVRTFGFGVSNGKSEFEICTTGCKAGLAGSGTGQFKELKGIAISATGNVYVSDAANSRVEEFKENGEFASMFGYGVRDSKTEFEVCTTGCKAGISGSGNGQFNAPRSVAVTPAGNVWVVESANSRVQEFNEKSEYVLQFGTKGSGNGQLKEPKGIALAANGNVIVADEGNSRIEIFSPTGTFLTTFGTKGTGTSQFEEPMSIAITPNENLYITDVKNNHVEQWRPAGLPANTTIPSISGELLVGQTLSASTGSWSAVPEAGYAYEWQRCNRTGAECAAITGATSSTHVLATADIEATLRVVVTATNTAGSSAASSTVSEAVRGPRTTAYHYDANGNLETVTDRNGQKTTYTYDADNEPIEGRRAQRTVTETGYDGDGQVISPDQRQQTRPPNTCATPSSEVTEVIDPLKRKILKEYDAAGNLVN